MKNQVRLSKCKSKKACEFVTGTSRSGGLVICDSPAEYVARWRDADGELEMPVCGKHAEELES